MDAPARKRLLRRATVERIRSVDPAHRAAEETALVERFGSLPGLREAGSVLLYVSAFPEEIATRPMIARALKAGQRVVLPRVDRVGRRLRLFEVRDLDADLVAGTLGIPEPRTTCTPVEPEVIDWVLVPGLAFDERCHRIGRGAGHYDRLLPTLRADAPRWALILDAQWVDDLPVESHDVPLDGVVSASRTATRSGDARSAT